MLQIIAIICVTHVLKTFRFRFRTFRWLEHTTPIFIALKTLKNCDLYIYQLAIHMFRHHRNLLPSNLPSISFINQSDIQNYNTRHVSDLHIAPTNTKLAGNTITTQGPIILNNMNAALKNCKSLATFKTCLKKYILDQYSSEIYNNMYASIV